MKTSTEELKDEWGNVFRATITLLNAMIWLCITGIMLTVMFGITCRVMVTVFNWGYTAFGWWPLS